MSVVSNASPLIGLARIGKLELLRQLYGKLVIPEAVEHEVVAKGPELPAANQVGELAWIVVRNATNKELVRVLQENLGAGEAEAIAWPRKQEPNYFYSTNIEVDKPSCIWACATWDWSEY